MSVHNKKHKDAFVFQKTIVLWFTDSDDIINWHQSLRAFCLQALFCLCLVIELNNDAVLIDLKNETWTKC